MKRTVCIYSFVILIAFVVEAWSYDETTFYKFNEVKLDYWNDVKTLIYEIEKKGVHLILWQYPVIKKLAPWQSDSIHALDEKYVIEKK